MVQARVQSRDLPSGQCPSQVLETGLRQFRNEDPVVVALVSQRVIQLPLNPFRPHRKRRKEQDENVAPSEPTDQNQCEQSRVAAPQGVRLTMLWRRYAAISL